MGAIDFFCSADDRHRVILLVDLLEKAGQRVNLCSEPGAGAPGVCLIACTRRAFREPWIEALFTGGSHVVAIRLDDAPLPGPCARSIDMQAWPARSADRGVGRLVHYLQYGDERAPGRAGGYRSGAAGAAAAGGNSAAADPSGGTGSAAGAGTAGSRRRPRPDNNVFGGLALLGVLLAGGVVMAMLAERQDPYGRSAAPQHEPARFPVPSLPSDPRPGVPAPIAVAPLDPSVPQQASADDPATRPAGAARHSAPPDVDAAYGSPSQSVDTAPEPALPAPSVRDLDSIRRLCLAATPEAAEAWAGVLSWKQRRSVGDEMCIAELVRRPGFERLGGALGLSGAGARMR